MSLASELQELKSAHDQGLISESEYQNAKQSALNNLIGGVGSGLNGGGGGGAIVTAPVVEPNVEMTSVVTEQPRYEALRFNQPPNPGGLPHPDGGNFFWQYYEQAECCPCKYGGCCLVFWCHPCVHGYVQEWARNDNSCCYQTLLWISCPCFVPCFLEDDRRLMERKIYMWHDQRGDPRARGRPFPHPGIGHCANSFLPAVAWIIHAQNYEVIKTFQAVQGVHLNS